jgi:hypothetical protein
VATKLPDNFDWKKFTPDDSPKTAPEVLADEHHRKLSTADVQQGELAYNFNSPIYDFSNGVEKPTGKHFDLLTVAQQKPVALIFGSYT